MSNLVEYEYLKNLCTVNQGLQIPISKRFKSEGANRYFYITVQFLKEGFINKFYIENPPKSSICRKDDILVVRTGNTGQVITGVEGCFHNNFFKVNCDKNKVVSKYLYYCLKTKEKHDEMSKRAGITTIPDLNHFMFLDIKIPLIDKIKQTNAVKVLDVITNKIELNNKINSELELMAKTLYNYWFVQFDFPNKNGKPYKTSGGKMVYNDELKKEIPEVWEVDEFSSKLKISLGGTPSRFNPSFWDNGNIPWLSSGEIANFPILKAEEYITKEGLDNSATKILKAGSLMISITGNIRASILGIDACANQSVVGVEEGDELKKSYIYFYILNYIPRYESLMMGAVQKHINKDIVASTPIILPPNEILEKYYNIADPIVDKIIKLSIENKELSKLRDWLLPMLMNGQVKVK